MVSKIQTISNKILVIRYRTGKLVGRIIYGAIGLLPISIQDHISNSLLVARHRIHEQIRAKKKSNKLVSPLMDNYEGVSLRASILQDDPDWLNQPVSKSNTPGMLTDAERKYYQYITGFYKGSGEIVEVGPWLGQSTQHLIEGLSKNTSFNNKKLYVYDDFVWRSEWMNKWLVNSNIIAPNNHESFLYLFERETGHISDQISVEKKKLVNHDGNELLENIEWDKGPIELIIIDCGRSLKVNEAWYRIFSSSFISDKTLIVMQDWQNYKRVPELYWENTKLFTDSRKRELDQIHEVKNAGIATFIYRGSDSD